MATFPMVRMALILCDFNMETVLNIGARLCMVTTNGKRKLRLEI